MRKPFVVYWNNIPSPYMVERFNALASTQKFDFEAWFSERREADRSWAVDESTWRFQHRYLPTTRLMRWKQHWPFPILGRRPDLLVSLYAEPCFLAGWLIAKLRGSRTVFWCQVTSSRWVRRRRWKEALKGMILPRADATLGGGQESREFAMRYGVAAGRALVLRHSIDVGHYARGAQVARELRSATRSALKLRGTTFVSVGRLWWGKGLFILLQAFQQVQRTSSAEVSLLIVGDGPEDAELRRICADRGIKNVVFAGFQQKEQLPVYYGVSDVFVFPTLGDPYGLVVDEAMACSLPIITSDAAGEIRERVIEGESGFVVPAADVTELADRMKRLASSPHDRERMGAAGFRRVRERTPERWAEDFERLVASLLCDATTTGGTGPCE